MKCEIFVREYLPAIRAIIAIKMINFGLTQQEIADKLYITQGAVALYKKQARGKKLSLIEERPDIREKIDRLAKKITIKSLKPEELDLEYCEICKLIFG